MGLVYHYTSPGAVLSILQNKALRFSDCEFMNDSEEIAYCYRLYDEAWADVCLEAGIPDKDINRSITSQANPYECVSPISEKLGFSVSARYYSFSTCVDADNLAMWSCYACKDGETGYALGFDEDLLAEGLRVLASSCADSEIYFDVHADEVNYDKKEQSELIRCLIRSYLAERNDILEHYPSLLDLITAEEVARGDHWEQISALAPFIKRPEFSYEREHRFVLCICQLPVDGAEDYRVDPKTGVRRKWRMSSSGTPIPYYELSLGQALSDALKEVRILHPGETTMAVSGTRRLLESLGCRNVFVREAGVRLRKL